MGRSDRIVFWVFAGAMWAYVIARAILVPAVHDEAGAFHMFVLTGDFVPFVAGWDVGNHVVFSALAQVSFFLFGESLPGLRVWCVLSFVLYAWYLWRSGDWFVSTMVRWCVWATLLCVPFMVEFFSLARGYGLAMGFWSMALFHLVRFMGSCRYRDLLAALSGTILATWSLLSMLVICGGVLGVLGVVAIRNKALRGAPRTWIAGIALGAVPLVGAVLFALGLQERGALYAGTDRGYVDGTISSICGPVLDMWNGAWTIVMLLCALMLGGLLATRSSPSSPAGTTTALSILSGLLLFDALVQTLSGVVLGSRGPMDRAALYLVQPAILAAALAVDTIGARVQLFRGLAVGLLIIPFRGIRQANVDYTSFWRDQAVPAEFYSIVAQRQRTADRPLLIGAQEFIAKSTWDFGARAHGLELNAVDQFGFPQPVCDLLMIDTTVYAPPAGFRVIARSGSGRNNLMERTEPLRTRVLVDSSFSSPMSDRQFRTFWDTDAERYRGRDLVLELSMGISSTRGTINSFVYAFVEEEDGTKPYDRHVTVDHNRGSSFHGSFTLAEHLPRLSERASRIGFGLFNPAWRRFSLDSVRLRVREVLP